MPKYYLADVPHDLRARVLDCCLRRLYYEALELLREHGFGQYSHDDLINFYNWAPTTLPGQAPAPTPDPTPESPRDYPQPSAELIDDIRKRLAEVSPEITQRAHDLLKHGSIEQACSLLWHSGAPFAPSEMYEYRKTLFPPNAMVDPYTAGAPVLRSEFAPQPEPTPVTENAQVAATASETPTTNSEPQSADVDQITIGPVPSETPSSTTDNGQLATDPSPHPAPAPTRESTDTSNLDVDPSIQESNNPSSPAPPPPAIYKRRGKISGLPKAVRQRVNEMLDEGFTYENVIESLNTQGFPSINKVNLHNWHKGGYQDWLREQERVENQSVQREWLGDVIARSEPGDLHHCIYTLFASQIMDSLFGINTARLKEGLAARPRDYVALMNGFNRLDKQLTVAPDFQDFLKRNRERKETRGMSPDIAYAILREMRLDKLLALARQGKEFKKNVKPG